MMIKILIILASFVFTSIRSVPSGYGYGRPMMMSAPMPMTFASFAAPPPPPMMMTFASPMASHSPAPMAFTSFAIPSASPTYMSHSPMMTFAASPMSAPNCMMAAPVQPMAMTGTPLLSSFTPQQPPPSTTILVQTPLAIPLAKANSYKNYKGAQFSQYA